MSQVFTDYVRALDPSGEPPDAESFQRVWAALGRTLTSELKRRGLWHSPPSYLGIYGDESWLPAAGDQNQGGDAFEELLAGCYSHVFVRRLGGLEAQLKVKPNIEGLVILSVGHFIHDAQKKHDPFGFRIFDVLRRALRAALDAGEITRLAGDPRIRNDTVLGFDTGADPKQLAGEELPAAAERWNDLLLPDLVTARGCARERLLGTIRGLLAKLPAEGVAAFTFQQLIDPLKNDARARWSALLAAEEGPLAIESDGDLLTLVRQIQPDTGIEDRDSFERLTVCLAEALSRADGPARTLAYLSALWEYLRAFAAGFAGEGMPSARKLARHLGIPRDRLPELFETLGEMVRACLAASSGKPPVNSFEEGPMRDRCQPKTRRAS